MKKFLFLLAAVFLSLLCGFIVTIDVLCSYAESGAFILLAASFAGFFSFALLSLVVLWLIYTLSEWHKAQRIFRQTDIYMSLQKFIDDVISVVPELKEKVGYANLYISLDSHIFQGTAILPHTIVLSKPWIALAACDEGLELVKTTICHELSHLLDYVELDFLSIIRLFFPRITDKALIRSWENEFRADVRGKAFYEAVIGNNGKFIEKLELLKRFSELYKSHSLTHPAWELRIEYAQSGMVPSLEIIEKLFLECKKSKKTS